MAGAYSAWERAKQTETARTTKPPKAESSAQAMQIPETLKEAEEAASKLRAKYRAQQAAAEAEAREEQRQAEATKAAEARARQQNEEHERLLDDHLAGANFVPAARQAPDLAKAARAQEYSALMLSSIAVSLGEIVTELRKITTSKRNPKNG